MGRGGCVCVRWLSVQQWINEAGLLGLAPLFYWPRLY